DFSQVPGVLEARRQNGAWHLALGSDANPQEIFRHLARQDDVTIERFEIAEPSLDDIFVRVVQEGKQSREADHA
ncbi:MAG: DUF4162 domain-containing protein, partial [Candidatus Promineifilaceae bacterium]